MESQNSLGIYISKDVATAVYLDARAKGANKVESFSVTVEGGEEQEKTNAQILAELIARGSAERGWKFSQVSAALDCTMFMQHSVHSEFREPKQIASTVKFDTEETLATDITTVALAFEIASSDETGSGLTVYTAERTVLSDILSALQQHNLDPITIEPDVNCLMRFIHSQTTPIETQEQVMFALLSRHCGYLIVPINSSGDGSRKAPIFRTFLLGTSQERAKLLTREVLVTRALAQDGEMPRVLRIFDSSGTIGTQTLRERLGMEIDMIDLSRVDGTGLRELDSSANPIEIAIAYGAALIYSEKGQKVDFRSDFSPFLGKKLRLQKALKFDAVSVTVLLIAVGMYFLTQLFNINSEKDRLRSKFARDYADVTLERLGADVSANKAVRNLGELLRRIKIEKMGMDPTHKSISSNLTLVLTAFNTCAAQTDLKIDSLTITDENVIVAGSVASRQDRLTLFEAIRRGNLEIVQEAYDQTGGRETFHITVRPKKGGENGS